MRAMKLSREHALSLACATGSEVVAESLRIEVFGKKTSGSGHARTQTRNNGFFDFLEPKKSRFSIDDIARSLSKLCRFTGHVNRFYSVAQHSVLVSRLVPKEHAFIALMHDSSEAFCNDISSPLKALLPDYKAIESRVEKEVLSRFGLSKPYPKCVKEADKLMVQIEQYHLMPGHEDHANLISTEVERTIFDGFEPLEHEDAYMLFMQRFNEVGR